MRQCLVVVSLAAFTASPLPAQPNLSAGDRTAAFQAAGFKLKGGQWQACGDPGTATYAPGALDAVRDLNGDGRPEAVISEGSLFCFGGTEVGYSIVSKQQDGSWRQVTSGAGIPNFLATKGVAGWPDIEVGGPGFCFPVERWNGKAYALHRHEYEGKACRPQK